MALPEKILLRKDEITADFLKLLEQHITDLLQGRATHVYHTRDFADRLFIHPGHLSNTLKLTTGKSPCHFMEERVLAESQRMLDDTDMPVAAIGYVFGYYEPTNFTKFFKGMCGFTPLQYRKSCRQAAAS